MKESTSFPVPPVDYSGSSHESEEADHPGGGPPQPYYHVRSCCQADWHSFVCDGSDASYDHICNANAQGGCTCQHG